MNTTKQVVDQSDEALFASYVAGDERSFQQLYNRLKPALWAMVWGKVRRIDVTEEIVQTCFLKLHANRHQFDATRRLNPWLSKIAHNAVIDRVRRLSRLRASFAYHAVPLPEDDRMGVVAAMPSPAEEAIADEKRAVVHDVLDTMLPSYREIIWRHHFEGMNTKRLAEEAHVPWATMRTRLSRAMRAFEEAWCKKSVSLKVAA